MLIYKLLVLLYLSVSDKCSSVGNVTQAASADGNNDVRRDLEGKIVGGIPIDLERVPYSAQIFNHGGMCAGTILNSWTLVTAAHCFDLNMDVYDIVVQTGSRHIYDFNARQYYVSEIVLHEKYNISSHFVCDIALVFMEQPIKFSATTKKAILVNTDVWMNPREKEFMVTGWGLTKYGGEVSKEGLMMAKLEFVPKAKCEKLHQMNMSRDKFCLYGLGIKDTCKGDSGGGVYWKNWLVGIVSHGDGCAKKKKPSVYANVYYFRSWIKNQMVAYLNSYCRDKMNKKIPS